MAKKGKETSGSRDASQKKEPRVAEEEEALTKLEAEAAKLRAEIALEEAKRDEILKEQNDAHSEWLFDRLRVTALQEDQAKLRASVAEKRSLHSTQTRIEKQRLLKLRLKDAAAAATKLLHSQAALVLREQEQIAHLCEAEAVASDFLQESLEVRASRLLLLGAIRMHHDQCLLQVRKEAEQKEADILLRHKVMTNKLREAKERALRKTINTLEESKAQEISDQQMESKKVSQNTKRFFSDVTSASLSLIRQLKKEQEELKHTEARSTKTLAELHAINRGIAEPLAGLREETAQLQHNLHVYTTELQQIASAKEACRKQEKLYQDLKLQQEVLQQQLLELQKQRQLLVKQLTSMFLRAHEQRALENTILEKKIVCLKEAEEVAEMQASEVSWIQSKDGLEPAPFSEGLTTLLDQKEDEERSLEKSIQKVKDLHATALDAFMGALHASGLATEDLGVQLMPTTEPDFTSELTSGTRSVQV